jgi:peptide/nickel transport system permease protein
VIADVRLRLGMRGGASTSLLRRSLRQRHTRIGLVFTAAIVLLALIGPFFAPYNPTDLAGPPLAKPSSAFWLGTDNLGRDVLSRTLWGGRTVVWMSFASATIGMIFGVSLGMVAGYTGGWLDEVLMRGNDVVLAFPQVVFVLLFVSLLGPQLWLIVLLVGLTWMPQVARVARGLTVEVIHREYVQSAEALGVPRRRMLTREILPNLTTPLLVEFGLRLTWSIAVIAAVSFLGFGIQPPDADWGLMINENRGTLTVQPWAVVAPATCIAIFAVGANFLTEGFSRTIARIEGGARS